ncbi:MAG: triose-phosphate isomerase, partial [Ruthenibacterium sp.]
LNQLAKAMTRADEVGILTIACADTVEEAKAIAELHPDIMVCEPTSLIGTGKVSDENYMSSTNEAVKSVSPKTLVLQAAGISSGQNVYDAILSGADGTGGTSGIVAAKDPCAVLDEMFCALDKIRNEIK